MSVYSIHAEKTAYRVLVGKLEQNRLEDLNIEGWILKWTFNKWDKGHGLN
jgi:hypothetical protein